MEENFRSDTPPLAVDIGFVDELLDRSNSESVESCGDVLDCEENVTTDGSEIWTDEKHSLYLEHLEVSFVKQLHQSMGLLAQCSDKNKRGKYGSQMCHVNPCNPSEQGGCWEMINHGRSNIFSHNTAKGLRMHTSPMSPELMFHTENRRQVPAEGTGQNFVDDSQNNSNTKARVKRLKTSSVVSSSDYRILPSDNHPTTDY